MRTFSKGIATLALIVIAAFLFYGATVVPYPFIAAMLVVLGIRLSSLR